jgi:hypothetical protein
VFQQLELHASSPSANTQGLHPPPPATINHH